MSRLFTTCIGKTIKKMPCTIGKELSLAPHTFAAYTNQRTREIDPMLFQYWPIAYGARPTLKQHWIKSSCLLGMIKRVYRWHETQVSTTAKIKWLPNQVKSSQYYFMALSHSAA